MKLFFLDYCTGCKIQYVSDATITKTVGATMCGADSVRVVVCDRCCGYNTLVCSVYAFNKLAW